MAALSHIVRTSHAGAAALALAAAVLVAGPASAQSMTVFGYDLNASLRARLGPSYDGSDDYTVGPAGGFSLSKPGSKTFVAPDDSAALALFGNETVSFGASARLRGGRKAKDDLIGMRKIDWAVEAGLFGDLWPTDWLRLRAEARRGFNGHKGVLGDLSADVVSQQGKWTLSAGPRYSYADAKFTRTYFGVTPAEALASPYIAAAYGPGAGPRYIGAVAAADYAWRPRWRLTADAGYRKLLGDAADSPLVAGLGSDDQFNLSLGFRYAVGQ